ncbi:Uncharacterised protein [Yersinia kristensenii]|uniref:Uncharacterized protein n=1 Tax=Yersinia kristensenii TaxID=28152 RepID=A0A0T9KWM1_YERKR|nr:Uncharacterised protein [Yersinia kristensenii]
MGEPLRRWDDDNDVVAHHCKILQTGYDSYGAKLREKPDIWVNVDID